MEDRYLPIPALSYHAAVVGMILSGDHVYCIAGEYKGQHHTDAVYSDQAIPNSCRRPSESIDRDCSALPRRKFYIGSTRILPVKSSTLGPFSMQTTAFTYG